MNKDMLLLPNFICVGSAKSGTTTLYGMLKQHTSIAIPLKEPFFFSFFNEKDVDQVFEEKRIRSLESYSALYEDFTLEVTGELSTTYLYLYEKTINNLKKVYGEEYKNIKIFMILRNPVDRAYSHYMMLKKNGYEDLTFEKAINPEVIEKRKSIRHDFDYLGYGLYYQQVKSFMENFPHVKIFLYEELKSPELLKQELFQFLNVPEEDINSNLVSNPSGIPRNLFLYKILESKRIKETLKQLVPKILRHHLRFCKQRIMKILLVKELLSTIDRNNLYDYYESDIKKLELLIDKKTGWLK